jgi:hypothetical protein
MGKLSSTNLNIECTSIIIHKLSLHFQAAIPQIKRVPTSFINTRSFWSFDSPKSPAKEHCEIYLVVLALSCYAKRFGFGLFIKFVGVLNSFVL